MMKQKNFTKAHPFVTNFYQQTIVNQACITCPTKPAISICFQSQLDTLLTLDEVYGDFLIILIKTRIHCLVKLKIYRLNSLTRHILGDSFFQNPSSPDCTVTHCDMVLVIN